MDQSGNKTHNLFAPWKVMLPVAIGLAVVVLMFLHDARSENIGAALYSLCGPGFRREGIRLYVAFPRLDRQ